MGKTLNRNLTLDDKNYIKASIQNLMDVEYRKIKNGGLKEEDLKGSLDNIKLYVEFESKVSEIKNTVGLNALWFVLQKNTGNFFALDRIYITSLVNILQYN